MAMTRSPCRSGFREQMAELVRSSRSPEELVQEFKPSTQSIRNRVGQADRDEGLSHDGLIRAEREELRQHRGILKTHTVMTARQEVMLFPIADADGPMKFTTKVIMALQLSPIEAILQRFETESIDIIPIPFISSAGDQSDRPVSGTAA